MVSKFFYIQLSKRNNTPLKIKMEHNSLEVWFRSFSEIFSWVILGSSHLSSSTGSVKFLRPASEASDREKSQTEIGDELGMVLMVVR